VARLNSEKHLSKSRKRWLEGQCTQTMLDHSSRPVGFLVNPAILSSTSKNRGTFGNPLNSIMFTAKKTSSELSPDTLKLLELVLDHIRSNLVNIRNTWGSDSVQYKSASEIMEQYLEENTKRLKVAKPDLEELMKKMSLDE
jgi:hypothetical protein